MTIVRIAILAGAAAGTALLGAAGCESSSPPPPNARAANASQSAPYAPGTGVASSSFDRHPRFYTGPNADAPPAAPATQPSGAP